ncbi:diphosphoinositol polyphosphate phosphohydrolase 1-like [Octopus sinensis]|uniref:diphosphoinositol-polyphosphate diphosphatase n=1 Tax=Octopus sinensis TaxID=2607531 RepID=A0A6P7TFP1_9MOLL|nr:diphosphoinositol polyphosphate phosphohydrolase 1-like [Octopus sinensis]
MVKQKTKTLRTYDEEGFRRRAACLCFRDESEQEILLVSSSRYKDRWIVPGGGIEPSEPPAIAAEREVFEEAGVRGKLGRLIGEFENNDKKHRTSVFAFIVTELLEEWEEKKNLGRKREWFSLSEAKEKLQHQPLQVTYLELLEKKEDKVS